MPETSPKEQRAELKVKDVQSSTDTRGEIDEGKYGSAALSDDGSVGISVDSCGEKSACESEETPDQKKRKARDSVNYFEVAEDQAVDYWDSYEDDCEDDFENRTRDCDLYPHGSHCKREKANQEPFGPNPELLGLDQEPLGPKVKKKERKNKKMLLEAAKEKLAFVKKKH